MRKVLKWIAISLDRAVRYGVRPDSSLIAPFMPYDYFNRLSEADAASVAAYLAGLPSVDNQLPATKIRPLGYLILGPPGMSPKARGDVSSATGYRGNCMRGSPMRSLGRCTSM